MAGLGSLTVDLNADTAKFVSDMGRAAQVVDKTVGQIKTALGALGVSIGVGVFVGAVKSISDYGESLNKASQKTGLAVEDLSKLRYAADLAMSIFRTEHRSEGSRDQTSMKVTRLRSARDIDEELQRQIRATKDVLGDIADAFAGMEDGAGKSALAVRLFGKAGADMIPR
jgi:hypothetical protein